MQEAEAEEGDIFAYGCISFGTLLCHNIFLLFHVDAFVSVFAIDLRLFYVCEIIFAFWNSINDLLFAWLVDVWAARWKRTACLRNCAPVLSLAFLSFWFPIASSRYGVAAHFLASLCLYDGVFTFIHLSQSAMLADIVRSERARTRAVRSSAIASSLASLVTFYGYVVWSTANLYSFQCYCLACSLVGGVVLYAAAWRIREPERIRALQTSIIMPGDAESPTAGLTAGPTVSLRTFLSQLLAFRSFRWFMLVALLQTFACTFNNVFFRYFIDFLLGDTFSIGTRAALLSSSYVLPHIVTIFTTMLAAQRGVHATLHGLFALKLVAALCALAYGAQGDSTRRALAAGLFVAANRLVTESACRLMGLALASLIDADAARHRRPTSVAALVYGTNAFVTKPSQSLAPAIGWWLLARKQGVPVQGPLIDELSGPLQLASFAAAPSVTAASSGPELAHLVVQLAVWLPVVLAAVQLLAWSRLRLTISSKPGDE